MAPFRRLANLMLVLLLLGSVDLLIPTAAYASPGDLDVSFDVDGKRTTDFASLNDHAEDVLVQPDGKILTVGQAKVGSLERFALARYLADGALDPAFGSGGRKTTRFGSDSSLARAAALQPDGRIVVVGGAFDGFDYNVAVARYSSAGSPDLSFSGDGRLIIDLAIGQDDMAYDVAIQPDGRIVLAGSDFQDFLLARLNTDGSLDATFSGDGVVATDFGFGIDGAWSVAVQPDGRIVTAGTAYTGANEDFAVARYTSHGALDGTFSIDGRATADFASGWDQGLAMALLANGKILVGGEETPSPAATSDFALARFTASGALDTSFNGTGRATLDFFGDNDSAWGLAVQTDGRFVLGGWAESNGQSDFALARFTATGGRDLTFSGDAKVTTSFGNGWDKAYDVALQSNGRIVAAGFTQSLGPTLDDLAVARYLP
jgi:uncharacterized delta-60 repeat protein